MRGFGEGAHAGRRWVLVVGIVGWMFLMCEAGEGQGSGSIAGAVAGSPVQDLQPSTQLSTFGPVAQDAWLTRPPGFRAPDLVLAAPGGFDPAAPAIPAVPDSTERRGAGWMLVAGLAGVGGSVAGMIVGGYLGLAADYAGSPYGYGPPIMTLLGAVVGSSVGASGAVHLASGSSGRWGPSLLASAGVGAVWAASMVVVHSTRDPTAYDGSGETAEAVLYLVLPLGQAIASLLVY